MLQLDKTIADSRYSSNGDGRLSFPRSVGARSERGYTIIEVLVTMLLLSIVLTGLAALQINTVRQVTIAKRANEATRLGQMVLEGYKVMQYATLASLATSTWVVETNKFSSAMSNVGPDGYSSGPFTVRVLIETVGTGTLTTVQTRLAQCE